MTANPIPSPRLEATLTGSGTELILGLAGPLGVECVVEASPDLESWTALVTHVLADGVFSFSRRRDALPAMRYYRAMLR